MSTEIKAVYFRWERTKVGIRGPEVMKPVIVVLGNCITALIMVGRKHHHHHPHTYPRYCCYSSLLNFVSLAYSICMKF